MKVNDLKEFIQEKTEETAMLMYVLYLHQNTFYWFIRRYIPHFLLFGFLAFMIFF